MVKRIVSYVLILAMINAMIVSCNNREKTVAPPPAQTSGQNDDGGGELGDPGKLHNDIVARFFKEEWRGEPMTQDELVAAVTRSSNAVLADRGIEAISPTAMRRGVEILHQAKRAGAFDFFSGETQDLAPLIQYMSDQGVVTRSEVLVLEDAMRVVRESAFHPAQSKGVQAKLNALGGMDAVSPAVRGGLSVMGHSHQFWSSLGLGLSATDTGPGGPVVIDPPTDPNGSFSYKTLATIAVDALAMIAVALLGPTISIAIGALASIAFYTFSPDECVCP